MKLLVVWIMKGYLQQLQARNHRIRVTVSLWKQWKEVNIDSLIISLVTLVEIFAYGITNANGRAVSDYALKKTVGLSNKIIVVVLDLCQVCLSPVFSCDTNTIYYPNQLKNKAQLLFCFLVKRFAHGSDSNSAFISSKLTYK